jgi:hypothetical protein
VERPKNIKKEQTIKKLKREHIKKEELKKTYKK